MEELAILIVCLALTPFVLYGALFMAVILARVLMTIWYAVRKA